MPLTMSELIDALPVEADGDRRTEDALRELAVRLSDKPIPLGRISRLFTFGTLQAKVAGAYLAWWLRTAFQDADSKQQKLNETHLRAAFEVLSGMSYMRGAIMKAGQVLSTWPDVVPNEFTSTLAHLQFEAPPMHFSLLREVVRNELGGDPEDIFDDFETEACAAASLGQVHRARLKENGQRVAIKIQYPGIAATIRSDFKNMKTAAFPMRLSGDWDSLKAQFDDIRRMLDLEVDYETEAENLRIARRHFREDDQIVVPRVYDQFCTRRVITMDFLEGSHINTFLAGNPSQENRDRRGHQIVLALFRLCYQPHILYSDVHPGNFLFMPDGRLGLIDFGSCHHYSTGDVAYLTDAERYIDLPDDHLIEVTRLGMGVDPSAAIEPERAELIGRYCQWLWEPMRYDGAFYFGGDYFARGAEMYGEMVRRRYIRSRPLNVWLTRMFFGMRAMLHQLDAHVALRDLMQVESTMGTD